MATQEIGAGAGTRIDRERVQWDRIYDRQAGLAQNLSWMEYVEATTFTAEFFRSLLKPLARRRVLSIGGGVDRFGISLAMGGHQVVCVDISPVASARTQALADEAGVADRLTARPTPCEEMAFSPASFDIVVCRRALHHMEIARVLPTIHAALETGGVFLAEEPVCLHPLVRWVHERFPFYGDAPHTPDEKELTPADLDQIRKTFRSTRLYHFDFLARESIAHLLNNLGWGRLLYLLGKTDYHLVNRLILPLRQLCNYVVVHATK